MIGNIHDELCFDGAARKKWLVESLAWNHQLTCYETPSLIANYIYRLTHIYVYIYVYIS